MKWHWLQTKAKWRFEVFILLPLGKHYALTLMRKTPAPKPSKEAE